MSLDEIIEAVKQYETKYVCVTGGEPLGHAGTNQLLRMLLDLDYIVSLETNGSFSVKDVPADVIKVIDLKCPDSGESEAMAWENLSLVTEHDQFKFVVASKADFDWAQKVSRDHNLFEKCPILYSPVHGKVKSSELAKWILDSAAPVTMQTQLHKEIWGPDQRGV